MSGAGGNIDWPRPISPLPSLAWHDAHTPAKIFMPAVIAAGPEPIGLDLVRIARGTARPRAARASRVSTSPGLPRALRPVADTYMSAAARRSSSVATAVTSVLIMLGVY